MRCRTASSSRVLVATLFNSLETWSVGVRRSFTTKPSSDDDEVCVREELPIMVAELREENADTSSISR